MTEKKKPGRPTAEGGGGEVASKSVTVYFTPTEKEAIRAYAQACGGSQSKLIRRGFLAYLRQVKRI